MSLAERCKSCRTGYNRRETELRSLRIWRVSPLALAHKVMTESETARTTDDLRVEDLPPVEPPSAGFIVQLFVVPALIVGVVCGIYFLFARAAATEHDWRQLVADVRSENPHVRWRAALGLAQALEADRQRRLNQGDMPTAVSAPLAENGDIATALSDLYGKLISVSSPNQEQTAQIEFLSKALGLVDVDEVSLPILRKGIEAGRPAEIRKHSMTGLITIVGRRFEAGAPLTDSDLESEILQMSREPEALVRHQSTFLLGLMPSDPTLARLHELLNDGDQLTQVNAAVALARNESLDGLPVFLDVLKDAIDWQLDPAQVKSSATDELYFERGMMLKNSCTALSELTLQFTPEQKAELVRSLEQVAAATRDKSLQGMVKELQFKLE